MRMISAQQLLVGGALIGLGSLLFGMATSFMVISQVLQPGSLSPGSEVISLSGNEHHSEEIELFWTELSYLVGWRSESVYTTERELDGRVLQWDKHKEQLLLVPTRPGLDWEPDATRFAQWLAGGEHTISTTADGDVISVTMHGYHDMTDTYLPVHQFELVRQTAENALAPRYWEERSIAGVLAIVIDDWGYASTAAEPLLEFPYPLTAAVLPNLPLTTSLAMKAYSRGHEVILHQPMEVHTARLNDPTMVGSGQDLATVRRLIEAHLEQVPHAVGLNNHMGSKATADPEVMDRVMQVLAMNELYFLDSLTTAATVGPESAQRFGIPFTTNRFFIDNVNDANAIQTMLRSALNMAERHGESVVIGHVRPATATALWAMVPEIVASGVQLVPVSSVLQHP